MSSYGWPVAAKIPWRGCGRRVVDPVCLLRVVVLFRRSCAFSSWAGGIIRQSGGRDRGRLNEAGQAAIVHQILCRVAAAPQ